MPNSSEPPTIASLLTPAGRGAVATIAVRGPRAVAAVAGCFTAASGLDLAQAEIGRVLFGEFRSADGSAEELVVCRTAEDEVEIHGHGGHAATQAVLKALVATNVRSVSWDEWLAATPTDLISAESILALTQATTECTAAILLDQYRGALRRGVEAALEAWRVKMAKEHEIPQEFISTQTSRFARVASGSRLGLHLTKPFRVVLTGKPNVGKSSLINTLCGYQRAIVSPQPGTTRDAVTASTVIAGWPVELVDTAGLRDACDGLEAAGIARAHQQILRADLVLLVVDHTVGWSEAEEHLLADFPQAQHARLQVVYNKSDLPAGPGQKCRPGVAHVSAATGHGLDELIEVIAGRLGIHWIHPGDAVPFTERQVAWLERAIDFERTWDYEYCLQQLLHNTATPPS